MKIEIYALRKYGSRVEIEDYKYSSPNPSILQKILYAEFGGNQVNVLPSTAYECKLFRMITAVIP
jgi:hypothetical protein